VHGLNAVLVVAIAVYVLRPRERPVRVVLSVAGALIGVSGAGFISLLGTATNDLVNSIFVLGALLGLLVVAEPAGERPAWRGFALSGLSAGVGLGLKYTAAVYVPGLAVIAVLAAVRRRSAAGLLAFALCAALGLLAVAGHHLLTLWRDFGNPLFPMLNNVFQSPYFEPVSLRDSQFVPRDAWQLLTYPLYWIKTNIYVVTEKPFRDWRGAMAYLAIAAVLLIGILRRVRDEPRERAGAETCGLGLVLVFVIISYFAWALAFGNYRYGVTLEMLTGVVVMGALIMLIRGPRLLIGLALALLTIAAATTVYPDWGRGRYGDRYIDVRVPPLRADSVVLIEGGQPAAYFIPFAEPNAQYLGIENNYLTLSQHNRLASEVKSLMRVTGRPKFIVSVGEFDRGKLEQRLAQFGLMLGAAPCQPIWSNLENPALSLCPAVPR
jgi:hypothetical protein